MKKYSFPSEKEHKDIQKFVLKRKNKNSRDLKRDSLVWTRTAWENKLDYEVSWFGVPIIQNPYDIVLMQELIFTLKPDVIVESGIAHGGSILYYASILELLGKGKVIGVDIDIRKHNRKLIEKHPFVKRIKMFEGSATDPGIVSKVKKLIGKKDKVLVVLDSDHSKDHVFQELEIYKDIVTKGSYIVVFDTFMPYLSGLKGTEPFEKNSPMEAVKKFAGKHKNSFEIDKKFNKFFVSSCPDGFLKRLK